MAFEHGKQKVHPSLPHWGRPAPQATLRIATGAAAVAALAAPLVECIFELANRTGVPPFYAAFLLAPVACDAAARSFDVWRCGTPSLSLCYPSPVPLP